MAKSSIAEKLARRTAQDCDAALEKSYNDMFGLPTGVESIVKLPLDCLHCYKNDPFRDRGGEEMERLARSILENGQQEPIIVRPLPENGQYEILAGRRRRNAIQANGGAEIDAVIRDANDDEAIMIVTETNLRNREKLLHSEKAFAYKLQLDTIKRQGKRTDLEDDTSTQFGWKTESANIVAEKNDTSKNEIRRYIRLTYLIPPLLELVDSETIPFIAGVDISYLDEPAQAAVHEFFFETPCEYKPDIKTAALLRAAFKKNQEPFSVESIGRLMKPDKQKAAPRTFSISRKKLDQYVADLPDDTELERLFLEFLESRFGKEKTA